MNNVFKIILSLTISGSFLILFLFFCKPFIKSKLSRQWQYYVWLIVIARLLLPFAPEGNLIDKTFEAIETAYYGDEMQSVQSYQSDYGIGGASIGEVANNFTESFVPEENPPGHNPIQEAFWLLVENIWLIWLGIAAIILMRKITIYRSFVRYVKAGMKPVSDIELLDRVAVIGEQIDVSRAVELCINPLISSPLLIGFFRPCIVIPSTNISDRDFHYTVLHELTHYRRRDMFYKWLVQITICLHWFNPLVHLMGREINKACEFACDEAIITKLGSSNVQDYGKTLLEAMALAGQYKETLASVTLSENKKLLKERLGAIVNFKNKSKLFLVPTLALTLVLLVGATSIGAYTPKQVNPLIPDNKSITLDTDITITAEINVGGIDIIPVSQDKITADFDAQYYDVEMIEEDGEWKITVTGKKPRMGSNYVKLYIPDTGCNITANVLSGSLLYDLPQNCKGSLYITAENSSVKFSSTNQYENCNISVVATNPYFMEYSHISYPDYFTKTEDKVWYENGTGTNEIDIVLTGFTNVDFE